MNHKYFMLILIMEMVALMKKAVVKNYYGINKTNKQESAHLLMHVKNQININ